MAASQDKTHSVISSLFIGPRAENLGHFRDNITCLLDELEGARKRYFAQDAVRIPLLFSATLLFMSSP